MSTESTAADISVPALPTFDALPLRPETRQAIDSMGFVTPTEVQLAVFGPAAANKDIIAQSRTGTGKTAAFGLPLIDRIVEPGGGMQALVLAPTRELALQSSRELERIGNVRGIRAAAVYGGAPMERQVRELKEGAEIVSGTPGRVLDHLKRGSLDVRNLKILVLDEADEMLSMGFARELNAIVELLPTTRKTWLFSATVGPDVQRLAQSYQKDPEFLALSGDLVGAQTIKHFVYMVSGLARPKELVRILEVEDPESAVIFCNMKSETEQVAAELKAAGFNADWLNGDLPQGDREKVMARTRKGELRYLVATDVAARGIDISHLTHVFNYTFPESTESYVHRSGRTGRAGRTGTAISLISPQELGSLYYMRLTYRIFPVERSLPTQGELRTRAEADRLGMLDMAYPAEPREEERALARRLLSHPRAERMIAGLLKSFFGVKGDDVDEQAGAQRRAKVIVPPVVAPSRSARPAPARAPRVREAVVDARPLDAEVSSDEGGLESVPPVARERRRRREPGQERTPSSTVARPTRLLPPSPTDDSMVSLFIGAGRREGLRTGELVRFVAEGAGLSGDDIVRARVKDRHSFVSIPKAELDRVVLALNGKSLAGRDVLVEQARPERESVETAHQPHATEPSQGS